MTDEITRDLIQSDIDGELDASGKTELGRLLADSEEARQMHGDLTRLAKFLDRVPNLEPPAELQARIAQAIELPAKPARRPFFRLSEGSTWLRYGFAGAAALVLAIAITANRDQLGDAGDVSSMVGTMTRPAGAVNILDRATLDAGSVNGQVSLELNPGGTMMVNVQLEAPAGFDLYIDLSGSGHDLDAFAQMEDRLDAFSYSRDVLRLQGNGRQKVVVMLNPAGRSGNENGSQTINFELKSQGVSVQSGSLHLAKVPS